MSQDTSKPKTLTISQPLSLAKEAQLSTVMKKPVAEVKVLDQTPNSSMNQEKDNSPKDLDRAARREAKQQRNVRKIETLAWLCETYPNCFNLEDRKPLKIGIFKDISEAMKLEPSVDQPSNVLLRLALGRYTWNLLYHQAVLSNSHRIDLKGEPVEEITTDDRTYSQSQIEAKALAKQEWKKRQKEKKKEQKKLDSDPMLSEESSLVSESLQS